MLCYFMILMLCYFIRSFLNIFLQLFEVKFPILHFRDTKTEKCEKYFETVSPYCDYKN
jgi:hypothetical protein